MARVLITRLSSFGDVAMLVPVIFSVASRYPQDRFVVLTRKAFAPLFENLGFNINAKTFDPNRHNGLGMFNLLKGLSSYGYTHVADIHDVLRTKIIRSYMSVLGKEVAYIDKGRKEKELMVSSKNTYPPLKSTIERYMDVFESLGFGAEMIFKNFFEFDEVRSFHPLRSVVPEKQGKWIGIAPFSKHQEKIYPLEKMEQVLASFAETPSVTVFLFGSGAQEREILERWAEEYPHTISLSGKLNLINELMLISYLDVMVSMDSANMHLASLVETPVVSIWGATHPSFGFYGFNQSLDNAIQIDLPCRPCSVYGEIPCSRGDYACLNEISESSIINKVNSLLKLNLPATVNPQTTMSLTTTEDPSATESIPTTAEDMLSAESIPKVENLRVTERLDTTEAVPTIEEVTMTEEVNSTENHSETEDSPKKEE